MWIKCFAERHKYRAMVGIKPGLSWWESSVHTSMPRLPTFHSTKLRLPVPQNFISAHKIWIWHTALFHHQSNENYPQERSVQMKTCCSAQLTYCSFLWWSFTWYWILWHFTIKETNLFNNSIYTFALWLWVRLQRPLPQNGQELLPHPQPHRHAVFLPRPHQRLLPFDQDVGQHRQGSGREAQGPGGRAGRLDSQVAQ